MRILVLGGDGYLGWPTAMRLSAGNHEVAILDDLSRRRWHEELGSGSLTPISSLADRTDAWAQLTGHQIRFEIGSTEDGELIERLLDDIRPEAIIHYAEQPSAPLSMRSRRHAVATQRNNVLGTLNVLFAIRDRVPGCHLIKLGTMGEYGTPNIDIEEGFIEIEHKGRRDRLPYPKQPGSIYHLSKAHDSDNIHFACRVWGLRSTDLHQGVVYGIATDETSTDERLATRFDYDEVFGTVLNRFCVQAVIGHPLTVHGEGGQTRGFLNIRDTLACVELALDNPPELGEYRVFNQFTEQFSVLALAELVKASAATLGYEPRIESVPNPRVELERHYYNAANTKLLDLGLEPHHLGEELVHSMLTAIGRHADRVIPRAIAPRTQWRPGELELDSSPLAD